MKNRLEMYRYLYALYKDFFIFCGDKEDIASRKANIKCVKTTDKFYLRQFMEI